MVQLEMEPEAHDALESGGAGGALKQQVAARLAAHRARRAGKTAQGPVAVPEKDTRQGIDQGKGRAARIAAAVAERYANSPSYRAFLAAEAEEAIQRAEAVAEVAAVTAKAVAAAQYSLLAELDEMTACREAALPRESAGQQASAVAVVEDVAAQGMVSTGEGQVSSRPRRSPERSPERTPARAQPVAHEAAPAGDRLTVRLYEEVALPQRPERMAMNVIDQRGMMDEEEAQALEEEIAFRHAPVFEEMAQVEIAANLIEFPRQLVAARKARPRLAEGPLREEREPDMEQLRIFEVQPEQLSSEYAAADLGPVWSSIVLGAQPEPQPFAEEASAPVLRPQSRIVPAALQLRLMAAVVDACVVLAATAVFAGTVVKTTGAVPEFATTVKGAALGLLVPAGVLWLIYQVLCLTLSDATAGMRYARLGLCSFADVNPKRRQRLRRLLALTASVCPLGLGLLWVWVDLDGLAWHDRMSKMYLREY